MRVGANELVQQIDSGRAGHLKKHKREIAGYPESPESRLSAPVLLDDACVGAQPRVGVQDRRRHPFVENGVGRARPEPVQGGLSVHPGPFEYSCRGKRLLLLACQRLAALARLSDTREPVDGDRSARLECEGNADRGHRVEHRTGAARESRVAGQRQRVCDAAAAADEARPVGLVRHLGIARLGRGHEMEQPGRRIVGLARPAGREDRAEGRVHFGVQEQLAECRVGGVGGGGRENDFGKARGGQRPASFGKIRDAHPAQLDVVVGRHRDLRSRLDFVVAPRERRHPVDEARVAGVGLLQGRLQRRRPDRGVVCIQQVAERSPIVERRVLAPSRHGVAFPVAVTAAGCRDHHVVAAVGKQAQSWHRMSSVAARLLLLHTGVLRDVPGGAPRGRARQSSTTYSGLL